MANIVENILEKANEKDTNKELFSEIDLKEFNNLVKDKADFDLLVKGFENETTINEIQKTKGLKETLEAFVKTKTGLADIFKSEYDPLAKDQDLYEVCVLGAILTKGKVASADYKTEAKTYYESIKATKVETGTETKKEISDTFVSGSSTNTEIAEKVDTEIKIETGKNITEASINVSAGADGDKMPLAEAKKQLEEKKSELITLKKNFNDENQKIIQGILDELVATNIESKILDKGTNKKNNVEQNGNRYLIASRLTGGLIEGLKKFDITPEPKLNLKIDWDKCMIGNSKTIAGKKAERVFTMNVSMTIVASTTEQKIDTPVAKTNTGNGATTNTTTSGTTTTTSGTTTTTSGTTTTTSGAGATKPTTTNTSTTNTSTVNTGNVNTTTTNTGTANTGTVNTGTVNTGTVNTGTVNTGTVNTGTVNTGTVAPIETPVNDVETAEIISLKKEIYEHFTIDGNAISREIDISNKIVYKNGIYTVAIKGYSGLEFAYDIAKKTIEVKTSTAGVRKGLFLYDITNQSVATDKTDKKDIVPAFNNAKTIEALNKQLEKNDKDADKKADYKVTKITGSTVDFEYEVGFIKDKADKTKTKKDTFTLELDTENNLIAPDSKGEGQVSQWKKITGTIAEDTDFVLDLEYQREAETKGYNLFYYLQTKVNTNGVPELSVMNNIQKNNTQTKAYESIYTEHKEITTKEFDEIKKDFINNKIERTFEGTLNESHSEDFENNRKITKGTGAKEYNFSIYFTKNDGTQQQVDIPFTMTIENNTRKYAFTNKGKKQSVIIDNISYDINTPDKADGAPSIKMLENQEVTLENAGKGTSDKLSSDIFSGEKTKRGMDVNNSYEVKAPAFSLGNIEFNTDNKGGYKRTVFFGEQKDDHGNILLTGEEKGTIYYDQEYKIIAVKIKIDGQEKELDFSDTKEEVKMDKVLEDINGNEKGVVLSPSIVKDKKNKTSLKLDFKTPEETDKNRKTIENYTDRIRAERKIIFTALTQLNVKKELQGDVFVLPGINNADETKFTTTKIVGPDGKGLYKRQLAKAGQKGREKYIKQDIYLKVTGTDLQLCDNDGNEMKKGMYVFDYKNEIYYDITVSTKDKSMLEAKSLTEIKMNDVAEIETEEVTYNNGKVNIELKNDKVTLLKSNYKDYYTFANNEHEMCTIRVDSENKLDETKTLKGGAKKPLIITNEEKDKALFGSYKKYFAGEGRENLGLAETDYTAAFDAIYKEDKYTKQDDEKKIVQVKLRSTTDKKYYYDYMAINQTDSEFGLSKLKGLEEAKEEMKRRLDNLVLLNKIEPSTKGDTLKGVKINKDKKTWLAYLKDATSPVKITLTDSNDITSTPIEVTLKDKKKWELANNTDLPLGKQKVNCALEFKDNLPFLKMEIIEQENESQ